MINRELILNNKVKNVVFEQVIGTEKGVNAAILLLKDYAEGSFYLHPKSHYRQLISKARQYLINILQYIIHRLKLSSRYD